MHFQAGQYVNLELPNGIGSRAFSIANAPEAGGEIELNILNLEQEPDNKDYINAIFRPFHSVKGVASFLNLDGIRMLAHDLETLLDKARNEALAVTPELIDLILDGSDTLKAMIGRLRDDLEGREATELIDTSDIVRRI
jgi:two-component system chemotaxis sensor kinase CheA